MGCELNFKRSNVIVIFLKRLTYDLNHYVNQISEWGYPQPESKAKAELRQNKNGNLSLFNKGNQQN